MLRHVVMVNFRAEAGQRERDEFVKMALETLAVGRNSRRQGF